MKELSSHLRSAWRQRLSLLALLLTTLLALPLHAAAQEAYAVKSNDGKTLTFYYDSNKSSQSDGTVYDVPDNGSWPGWQYETSITTITFDGSFSNYRPTNTSSWFRDMPSLTTFLNMRNLNTSQVTAMTSMFKNLTSLQTLDLSTLNTSRVTAMNGMFQGCSALKSVNVSGLNTHSVTQMMSMFSGCSALTTLDLSNFNTQKVAPPINPCIRCTCG